MIDRSKLTHCRTCEAPLEQAKGESPKQFERRTRDGYCRAKCKPKRKASPARSNFGLDIPTKRNFNLAPGYRTEYLANARPREFTGSLFKEVDQEDPKYRAFIREQPCLVPGCRLPSECHHQNKEGHGKMGGKCDDRRGIPFCACHHTGGGTPEKPGSYHGPGRITGREFLARYCIDPEKQIARLNAKYELRGKS